MQNHLKNETSPYLLQHVENPVDWYPWCDEAFEKASTEDKPIFLSIGYSTCHWCHVMAHESFEDAHIAEILNKDFISIKVDKEERPDIDSIYMRVCQAFTGGGGWPTTIFMTPNQQPFFAGTYFSKTSRYGQIGFKELLIMVSEKWRMDRDSLMESADEIMSFISKDTTTETEPEENLISSALEIYKKTFDNAYGGFGNAPKFPTPHNLLFLMTQYEKSRDESALKMAEKTLLQMYRGGIFDHIGWGFSRYSTDRFFLAPHFEKMLYDNALLMLAYSRAFELTENSDYCDIAEKTAAYILREMTSPEGGFYSAQDADSEGVEGKYYLFDPSEIIDIIGADAGAEFNKHFDITEKGNFEGKNILNLLNTKNMEESFDEYLPALYEYRKKRNTLHLDDKILTSWNGLMIGAMCHLFRVSNNGIYLEAAEKAQQFIFDKLCDNDTLYVSFRKDKHGKKGFLDDYANEIFALLALYEATFDNEYLNKALIFCSKVVAEFYDEANGGFFLYGKDNEQLIMRPKETYDGAMPSGNSMMAYNLVRLYLITGDNKFEQLLNKQLLFMSGEAQHYPAGYAMFLLALSDFLYPPMKVTVVVKDREDLKPLPGKLPLEAVVYVLEEPTKEYPIKDDKTTYYVCKGRMCLPSGNDLDSLLQ